MAHCPQWLTGPPTRPSSPAYQCPGHGRRVKGAFGVARDRFANLDPPTLPGIRRLWERREQTRRLPAKACAASALGGARSRYTASWSGKARVTAAVRLETFSRA